MTSQYEHKQNVSEGNVFSLFKNLNLQGEKFPWGDHSPAKLIIQGIFCNIKSAKKIYILHTQDKDDNTENILRLGMSTFHFFVNESIHFSYSFKKITNFRYSLLVILLQMCIKHLVNNSFMGKVE
jgi:hypothetical protein